MRVLVCGGRNFNNAVSLYRFLDMLHAIYVFDLVIHGGAHGADTLGDNWAWERQIERKKFTADWATHKRAAGPIRNQQMLDEGKPDLVVAFPGGRGTSNMMRLAIKAGVKLLDLSHEKVRAQVTQQWKARTTATPAPHTSASATGSATSDPSAT